MKTYEINIQRTVTYNRTYRVHADDLLDAGRKALAKAEYDDWTDAVADDVELHAIDTDTGWPIYG